MEIRLKDKIFLALFIPALALGAYIWYWRLDAAKVLGAMETEAESLVSVEDFPAMKARAARMAAEAKSELEAAKALPKPETSVRTPSDSSLASRESAIMDVFRASLLVVVRSEVVKCGKVAKETLEASGAVGEAFARRYTLDGTYPGVRAALDRFNDAKMPVIVERVEMRPGAISRWTITLYL